MTVSVKKVLTAIRSAGLTARSGFDANKTPLAECANVVVLSNAVVNVQTFTVLDWAEYGAAMCHPRYAETKRELRERVFAALVAAGVNVERSPTPDQLFINGYKPTR